MKFDHNRIDEQVAQTRAKYHDQVRRLLLSHNYPQVVALTGLSLRTIYRIAEAGGTHRQVGRPKTISAGAVKSQY